MGRAPCCDKANVKRGPWSPEEDSKLKSYIEEHGTGGNWIALPQKIGLKRCGKSCRLRWLNYLRPNIRHGGFSEEEDDIICNLYTSIGSRWSIIAAQLPGRTDNDIKNYWNTRLKKKLIGKQRKEKQARQASALKQETKREIETSFMVSEPLNQVLYWPQLPVAMSVANLNEETRSKDQALIKNLLVKLGGKFSDHHHHHQLPNNNNFTNFEYPFGTLDQLYDNSIGTFSSSLMPMNSTFSQLPNTQYVINGEEPNMIQGLNNFTIDELESFSRVDMVNASNNSSSAESTSYGDISSLVYPPMASNYEPYQPAGMVQDSEFEESRYFRLQ